MATAKTASCFQGGVRFQDGSLQATAAFGTVTSVAMTGDGVVLNSTVLGSPITVSGTLAPTLKTQTANFVFAGPTSGGVATPTFRALVTADLPAGTGTVTSVAMTGDNVIYSTAVGGSPITTSGTLIPALKTQTANFILAGPTSGGATTPTFRAMIAADEPSTTVNSVTNDTNVTGSISAQNLTLGWTGTLAITRGGTGAATTSQNFAFIGPTSGSGAPSFRALVAGDIPSLSYVTSVALTMPAIFSVAGSPITSSGTLAVTLANETANTVWAGPTSGGAAAPTFRALVAADIAGLVSTAWSSITAAAADLTLANTTFNTTFNQTSAVNWKWANTTVATSSANNLSPILNVLSDIWSNGADTVSGFTVQSKITAAPNNKTITNSSENSSNIAVLTVGAAHGFTVGNRVTLTGLTTATWLNLLTLYVSAVAATTISVIDTSGHGTSASHADTGTVTLVPPQEFTIAAVGTAGDSRVIFPLQNAANANVGTGGFAFAGQAALAGFGTTSLANGGFAIYTLAGGSSSAWLGLYRTSTAPQSANSVSQQVANIDYGDNSAGNSTVSLNCQLANFSAGLIGAITTSTSNPSVFVGNNSGGIGNFTATAGNQIAFGIGFGKAVTTANQFAPTSGTATFQAVVNKYTVNQTGGANGAVTGILVNAVETAVGGTHLLLDLQAGAAGTTSKLAVNNSGVCTKYAGITTVSQGQPAEYATVDLTAQTAAIAATTLYAVPAGGSGMYRISWSADITTAATTSSILGGTNGFQVVYTSPTDSVVKTTVIGNSITSAANTTGTAIGGCEVVYAKASTNIQYSFDYTSIGVTPMAFEIHVKIEAM
jgi:hypothetical protein